MSTIEFTTFAGAAKCMALLLSAVRLICNGCYHGFMPNYGRILTHKPLSVASGTVLTLTAPPAGVFKFVPGVTFVHFRLGALAQISVIPAGLRHNGDHELTLEFPELGAGTYTCVVSSELDLAETTEPVQGAGMAATPARDSARLLHQPAPPRARPGDLVTITVPDASPFVFDASGIFVTFIGDAGTIYQATVPPAGVTVVHAKAIRVIVPQVPPGAYAVSVSSGIDRVECEGPQVVLPGAGGAQAREATPALAPMLNAPMGATPTTRITITSPYTNTPMPVGPVSLGRSAPLYPFMASPSLLFRASRGLRALVRGLIPVLTKEKSPPPRAEPTRRLPRTKGPISTTAPNATAPVETSAPVVTAMAAAPGHYVQGCAVEYLVDGESLLERLSNLMGDVAGMPGDGGYLHLAFWICDEQTVLDGTGIRFIERVRALGSSHKEVKLALWHPATTQNTYVTGVRRVNERCKSQIDALRLPSVEVQLLPHTLPFGSHHGSVVVAGLTDRCEALLGGVNVHSTYRDSPPHAGTGRHDLAVQLSGPAAGAVEAHWAARWALTRGGQAKGPTPTGNVGDQSVFVGTTEPPRMSIRDELVARIQNANQFVYMENNGIFDPEVMTALGQKIKSKRDAGHEFQAILLMPNQALQEQYAWLHYVTYCHLSFMNCSSFSFIQGDNTVTVDRDTDGRTTWSFDYSGKAFGIGNWYEDSTLSWDSGSTIIKNIRSFQGETLLYTLEHCTEEGTPNPVSHVHIQSKVAIVDDTFAAVGSANFTPRSMRQDWEMCAFIHGNSVPVLRAALWKEHFSGAAPTPTGWWAAVRANYVARNAGHLKAGQLYAMPFQFAGLQNEPSSVDRWIGTDQR